MTSRRQFLSTIAGSGISTLGLPLALRADEVVLPQNGIAVTSESQGLVKLIDETSRERMPEVLVEQMRRGVPYRELLAAAFLFAVRRQGGHSVYIVHAAHQLSLDVPPEDRILPLFWAVDVMKEHLARFGNTDVEPLSGKLPSPEQAAAEFDAAMKSLDRDKAEHAVIALSRAVGPQQTYSRILSYASRDGASIGHIPIGIVNGGRVLPVIGWQHAEPVLRWIIRDMYGRSYPLEKQPYPHNVERVNLWLPELPADWAGMHSNPNRVLELYRLILQLKWWNTNDWIVEQLSKGVISSGTVWDAVHLVCADMMIRHKKGGDRLGNRALHSNTCTNALHYAFRNLEDSRARLLTLLQAVSFVTEFVIDEDRRGFLRDLSIAEFAVDDTIGPDAEVVESLFAQLPPRLFLQEQTDRTGQDAAARLAFSLMHRSPTHRTLFQMARHNMCRKLTLDAHEMKFPIAMFEDMNHVSPNWRPHMTAATVVYLQGANSVDNPAVQRGLAALQHS